MITSRSTLEVSRDAHGHNWILIPQHFLPVENSLSYVNLKQKLFSLAPLLSPFERINFYMHLLLFIKHVHVSFLLIVHWLIIWHSEKVLSMVARWKKHGRCHTLVAAVKKSPSLLGQFPFKKTYNLSPFPSDFLS